MCVCVSHDSVQGGEVQLGHDGRRTLGRPHHRVVRPQGWTGAVSCATTASVATAVAAAIHTRAARRTVATAAHVFVFGSLGCTGTCATITTRYTRLGSRAHQPATNSLRNDSNVNTPYFAVARWGRCQWTEG